MNRLIDLDRESLVTTFGPGAADPQVESQLRALGYTLGHFPQSWELSTPGGWVTSRSSNQQSLRYEWIEQLFTGGILETFAGPLKITTLPTSAAGSDLRELVLGSEGRFGITSSVKVRVSPLAEDERFYSVFPPNWQQTLQATRELAQARVSLSMLRLSSAVETMTQLAPAGHPGQITRLEKYLALRDAGGGKYVLTLGVTGNRRQNGLLLNQVEALLKRFGRVFTGTLLGHEWAQSRFRFPYLREALRQAGHTVDTPETAIDQSNVDGLLQRVEASLHDGLATGGERVHVFAHLSYIYGEGSSVYTTYVSCPTASYATMLERWKRLKHAASQAIVDNRGIISHQHGVGEDHALYLPREKGELGVAALRATAGHFNPAKRFNRSTLLQD